MKRTKARRPAGDPVAPRIIFLDFDGVMHPPNCPSRRFFEKLPLLERLLRPYRDVQIVVASSWRRTRTLDELRDLFSPAMRPRVVGATPVLKWQGGPGHRQKECLAWLAKFAPDATWIAMDDEAALYEPGRVIVCDAAAGLGASEIEQLQCWLSGRAVA